MNSFTTWFKIVLLNCFKYYCTSILLHLSSSKVRNYLLSEFVEFTYGPYIFVWTLRYWLFNHKFHSSFSMFFYYFFFLICLWWRDFPFIIFQYYISVSKPIIGCYKQVYFPKHSTEGKIYITLLLLLQKIRELVSETHLSKHELVKVYTCMYLLLFKCVSFLFRDFLKMFLHWRFIRAEIDMLQCF